MEGIFPSRVMEIFAADVKEWLLTQGNLPLITCAASLANHGLLRSLEVMKLHDQNDDVVNLTSVPAEHLASLVSCVTSHFVINNVIVDLVTILDNVKCKHLSISRQNLGSEETQALVQAMESHVKEVGLIKDVALDIRSLMDYSGQGKCRGMWCYSYRYRYRTDSDTGRFRYRKQLKTWAKSKNWEVTCDNDGIFSIIVRSGEV